VDVERGIDGGGLFAVGPADDGIEEEAVARPGFELAPDGAVLLLREGGFAEGFVAEALFELGVVE
jgi:hypothetical protein